MGPRHPAVPPHSPLLSCVPRHPLSCLASKRGGEHLCGHTSLSLSLSTCGHSPSLEHSAVSSGSVLALRRFPPPFPFFPLHPITPCPGLEGGAQKHSNSLGTAPRASLGPTAAAGSPGTHLAPQPGGKATLPRQHPGARSCRARGRASAQPSPRDLQPWPCPSCVGDHGVSASPAWRGGDILLENKPETP